MTPATLPAQYADAHAELDRDEGEVSEAEDRHPAIVRPFDGEEEL